MDYVCTLPNSCSLYVEDNEAGGRTYYSDEIGSGVLVWDTALVNKSTLLTAIEEEDKLIQPVGVTTLSLLLEHFNMPCAIHTEADIEKHKKLRQKTRNFLNGLNKGK